MHQNLTLVVHVKRGVDIYSNEFNEGRSNFHMVEVAFNINEASFDL